MNDDLVRTNIEAGRTLFNDGQFWEAHEAWEAVWLESEGETKLALQALIQLAAAHYHFERDNEAGALRLIEAAREKLARCSFDSIHRIELSNVRRAVNETPYRREAPKLSILTDGSS